MGLLDFLGSDDAKLGLGLLAAGGQSATPLDTWQRVQGAMQGMDADKANKMRLSLLASQVDENKQQALLRQQQMALAQRQQAMKEQFYGVGLLGAAPAGEAPGALSGGVSGAAPAGAVPASGATATTAQALSKQYGIPVESLIFDMMNNDGKGIPEMIFKRGTPDMQVSGNYAYDKNKLPSGYLPSLNISQDGKSSLVQIGPDGQPVVSAPRGALSTYNAYTDAGNRSAAAYKEGTPTIGPDGRKVIGSVLSNVMPAASGAPAGYATEAQMRTTAAGDMGADPKAIQREIRATQNDLMKPGLDEGSKQMLRDHLAGLQKTATTIGVKPMAGNVVELSPAEIAANEAAAAAAKVGAVKAAEGKAENALAAPQKAQQAGDAITLIDKALSHPGLKTAVGLSGKIDPRNYIPGTDAQDFQRVREQLGGTAFMTAYQGLRGGGGISEKEGAKAESAVARLSTAQSEPAFREALKDYRDILERGYRNAAAQARGETPQVAETAAPAKPQEKRPAPMKGMTMDGYKFKGGNPADPNNWAKL